LYRGNLKIPKKDRLQASTPLLMSNKEEDTASRLKSSEEPWALREVSKSYTAPDFLEYVDGPVWRRGNGEVLVGRDVQPYVGMEVVLSRQARRFFQEQGMVQAYSGQKVGKVLSILAGSKRTLPISLRGSHLGASCQVLWGETDTISTCSIGFQDRFDLVPAESDARLRTWPKDSVRVQAISSAGLV